MHLHLHFELIYHLEYVIIAALPSTDIIFIFILIFSIFEANDAGWPTLSKGNASLKPSDWKDSVGDIPSKTASPAGTPSEKVRLPVSVFLSLLKEYLIFEEKK